ncbi:hypothetical protein [Micromonospora inaquosa]|nr:hypothetical protein [Micromonospora inaquosa]
MTMLALGACAQSEPTPATTSVPGSPSTTAGAGLSASLAAGGVIYRRIDKACEVLDPAPLREVFGEPGYQQDEVRQVGTTANMTCAMALGKSPGGAVVTLLATVGGPASGHIMYEGLRGVQQDSGPMSDIAGLGAGAYSYTDELTGTHVVVYDNNLYLTLGAAPLRPGAAMPGDLVDRLTRVASAALSGLHG